MALVAVSVPVSASPTDIVFKRVAVGMPSHIVVTSYDGGQATSVLGEYASAFSPAWSPDGREIVFTSRDAGGRGIFAIGSDGEGMRHLTQNPARERYADWSPDGSRIAFQSDRDRWPQVYDIFVMNANGTNQRNLTDHPAMDMYPDWSPDGREIVFASSRDGRGSFESTSELYTTNTDGMSLRRITTDGEVNIHPAWSPDGTRIAFASERPSWEIWVIDADGSNLHRLTYHLGTDLHPTWSPDGTQIAFERYVEGPKNEFGQGTGSREIFVMNADGTDQHNITNHPAEDVEPDWRWPGPVSSLTSVGKYLDVWGRMKTSAAAGD